MTPQQALENLKILAKAANKAGMIDLETVPAVLESLAVLQSLLPPEQKQIAEAKED